MNAPVNPERLKELFFSLVKIYSPTFQEKEVADFVAERCSALGFDIKIDKVGREIGSNTGNVIVTLPGNTKARKLAFAAHMDTVEPANGVEPILENGIFRSGGPTILGADNKAGVAALLEFAHLIKENNLKHGEIKLVFTVAEEKGLQGAKHINEEDIAADCVYVLDHGGPVGGIVTKAPYQNTITAVFKGESAHAGVEPEKGVNAIAAASRAISLMELGRIDDETTANIGMIEGGVATNIVPDEAKVSGEARSLCVAKLERQTSEIKRVFQEAASNSGASVQIDVRREFEGFNLKVDDPVVATLSTAMHEIGRKPCCGSAGGGSDTNEFIRRGIPCVNISIGSGKPHTQDEYVSLDEMTVLAGLLIQLTQVSLETVGKRD